MLIALKDYKVLGMIMFQMKMIEMLIMKIIIIEVSFFFYLFMFYGRFKKSSKGAFKFFICLDIRFLVNYKILYYFSEFLLKYFTLSLRNLSL